MFKNLNKQAWFKPFLFGISVALIINYGIIALLLPTSFSNTEDNNVSLIKVANAAEIYPEFLCTCCDKPLDPADICCGMMSNMIDYIDQQVDNKLSKDEIMMSTAKQFGFKAIAKESVRQELRATLLAQAPDDAPKIVLSAISKDLGQISQAGGTISTIVNFTNTGQGDLVIDKINTSCGCTSAAIVYQGKEGPSFTMPGHGKANPENWQVAIAPGDTAQLKVYYDPMAHGKQKEDSLDITRTVSIFSNDPVDFEQKIKIDLIQLP
jgi:hypothetical protein